MTKTRVRQAIAAAGAILVLLGLTVYTLIQCGVFSSGQLLTTAYATDIQVNHILTGKGYAFRDETVIRTDVPSVCDSVHTDGAKISAGAAMTETYACATVEEAAEKQKRLSELDAQIAFLSLCSSVDGLKLSDADALRAEMYQAYHEATAASGKGDALSASEAARKMLVALSRYNLLTKEESGDSAEAVLTSLKKERNALLDGKKTTLYSERSGYFYSASSVDGYESLFLASGLLSCGGDELFEKLDAGPGAVSYAVGKLVTDYVWYLVVPVSSADGDALKDGDRYPVTLTGYDGSARKFSMTLETRKNSTDGRCALIFSCTRAPADFAQIRLADVSIETGSVTGYRVPDAAVTEVNGEPGVYILDGSTARFRRITVLARYDGYCVVAARDTSAEDYRTYLNRDDRIILDGKDLYDGKQYD